MFTGPLTDRYNTLLYPSRPTYISNPPMHFVTQETLSFLAFPCHAISHSRHGITRAARSYFKREILQVTPFAPSLTTSFMQPNDPNAHMK